MRGNGQGLAVMVRRALARLVARRDILGLAVVESRASNLAQTRVTVSLRKRAALDGGALMAFGRNLRRMLHLPPGAGLPLLVIRLAEEDPPHLAGADPNEEILRDRDSPLPGHRGGRDAGPAAHGFVDQFRSLVAPRRKRRRSRSPPSPWSVSLSACG